MFDPSKPDDEFIPEASSSESDGIRYLDPDPSQPRTPLACRACGSWLNADSACPTCASRRQPEVQFGELHVSDRYQSNAFDRPAYERPEYRSRSSHTIGSALILFLTLLGSFGILFIDPGNVVFEFAVSFIDTLIVLGWVLYHRDLIFPLMKLPDNLLWLVVGLVSGVVTFVLTTVFLNVLADLMGVQVLKMTDHYFDAGYGVFTAMLVVVVQPMIVEEFAFRGVIFKVFERVVSLKEAMLFSVLMFAALHLSPFSVPHTFLIGLLAVLLLHHTGSIWPGVLLHGMHNFLVAAQEIWW